MPPTPALFERAALFTDRVAIVADGESHTYGDLLEASAKVAALLLKDGDDLREARIAFIAPPGFDYVAAQWGIWRGGGVAVPLGLKHPEPELDYVITDTGASSLIAHPRYADRVRNIVAKRGVRLLSTEDANAPSASLPELDGNRRAMILYTSGTTSRPKGVVTTHANIQAQVESLVDAWEWSADDRILNVLPMHHIHGIINVLSCPLWSGAACEFAPFDAAAVWRRITAGGLTLFMAVPTVYAKLIAAWREAGGELQREWTAAAGDLRLMVSGSAALPVSTLETWREISGHVLLERYGMTEIGMALSNPLRGERLPGRVGSPLPGVETRCVNESGQAPGPDESGEIEVRGATVFLEYWGQPEATAASFRDGWFRTGDVATVDEDNVYRILGRNSVDIIKTGGYKVSALEIEEVLRTHPDISECAVVGVPDEIWGELVSACLIAKPDTNMSLESLREWSKERLASYKAPSRVMFVDELPRNAMGKVQKPRIVEQFVELSD